MLSFVKLKEIKKAIFKKRNTLYKSKAKVKDPKGLAKIQERKIKGKNIGKKSFKRKIKKN